MVSGSLEQFEEQFWARHSNPKSGWRQHPVGTALGTALAAGLKLWWVRVLVTHYDQRTG